MTTVADLHEQEAEGCEEEFANSADDADEEADVGGHAQLGDGHGESSFAAAQLKGQEEEEVGEETREGKDEEGEEEGGKLTVDS